MNREELKSFIEYIDNTPHEDDERFKNIIATSSTLLGLTDDDYAKGFEVCRTTALRWRKGTNAPHPIARKSVFSWVKKRAKKLMKNLKSTGNTGSSLSTCTCATKGVPL